MLVQVGPPAPSETAPPNGVLPVIPGDRKEVVEIGAGNCHSDAMRGSVPVSPDRPTKIVLRRSLKSAQYTSIEFGHRCRDAGVRPSMGSVGDAYDNAMCESFFATLECELLARHRFKTQTEARNAVVRASSKASTIRGAAIPRSDIFHRSTTSAGITRRRSIPTHTSLPPCSRPSRTSPPGGRKMRPSLTAAARDGRTIVRAGTEEWLRRGPNQRMARHRRATCRQIRSANPKLSPLHETGVSPLCWKLSCLIYACPAR